MDEVLEAIEDDVEREDNDFAIPPSYTDAPPSSQTAFSRVKIDHVWKFFRAHLKVYDEQGDLKFSFDAIPSANNDLSSLEGEHLTYQSHTSDDSIGSDSGTLVVHGCEVASSVENSQSLLDESSLERGLQPDEVNQHAPVASSLMRREAMS